MNEIISKRYTDYLTYILINRIFLNKSWSRLTDIHLYINNEQTFNNLKTGKKREEIRCMFPSVIGPLKKSQKRYVNCIKYIHIGDVIRLRFKDKLVYSFVKDLKIYKDVGIRDVLTNTNYKHVIPHAKSIDEAVNKYTTICYKNKLKKYNKFYYIFNIKLLPIFYI